jgi:quercetin dioxygenase-like cupin family protein
MTQSRRSFFGSVLAILAWLLAPFQSRSEEPAPAAATGAAIPPDDGEHLLIGPRRAPVTIKVGRHNNSSRMAVGTENIAPGDRIPIHKHGREDEIIFIHSGEGTMTLGEERIAVKNGATVFVPQGVWHGLENSGTEMLVMLWVFSPSGFEQYFRDIGVKPDEKLLSRTNEQWHAVDAQHAITYR